MATKTGPALRSAAAAPSAEMPGFIKPQMATLKAKAPPGDQWVHEIKFDGYRVQVHLNKGKKRAFTRNGLDWTKRFFRDRRRIGCSAALDICDRHRKPHSVRACGRRQRARAHRHMLPRQPSANSLNPRVTRR